MKCEVCGTKIPIGTNECTNCGYKFKDSHINTFDISSKTHEHIQTQKVSQYNKSNRSRGIITAIVIVFILMLLIPFSVSRYIFNNEINYHNNEDSFQELINQGYDENGVIRQAVDDAQDAENYLRNNLKLNEVETNQDHYKDNGELRSYSFEVTGYKDDIYCGINYSYYQGKLESQNFFLLGNSTKRFYGSELSQQQESLVKSFGQFVGDNDVFHKIEQANQKMIKNEYQENEYIFNDYIDNVHIYLTERDEGESSYHYYISATLYDDKGV